MKITKEDSKERDEFVLKLFLGDPDLSIPKAEAAFKEKFKATRRRQRMYQLRNIARQTLKDQEEAKLGKGGVAATIEQAARGGQRSLPPGGRAAIIPIRGESHGQAVREALEALNSQGVTKVRVPYATKTYLVVES